MGRYPIVQSFFRKLFGIYPGEGKKTLRFAILVITWSLGATCISTLTDGLFIKNLGESYLPKVYLIAAISMIVGSSLILALLKILSPYKILMGVLTIGVITISITAIAVYYTPPLWFWFVIKAFSLTFLANLIACSWALIDNYHDLQDAKRTYSMYNASYFLGAVISGLLISNFLEKIGITALFALSSAFLLTAIFLVKKIVNKDQPIHDETVEGVFAGDRKGMFYLIKQIFSHPFVFSLLCLSLIIQLIGTTTEYSYLSSFSNFLGNTNESDVTKYLGNTRAIVSAFNIIIGVFFYNRFVKIIGLRNIILLPAFAFFFLFGKWLSSDSLILAILGVVSLDGISYTIEDNNYNQLVNAVPSKLKAKVRIINDSFFEPLGMLISSSLLLYTNSRQLGFVLGIIMIIFSFLIRAIYHKYVFINLKENAVHFDRKSSNWIFAKTKEDRQRNIQSLIKGLNSSNHEISLLSIECLLTLNDKKYLDKIIKAVNLFKEEEKLNFISLIESSAFSKQAKVLKILEKWSNESSNEKLVRKCSLLLTKKATFCHQRYQKDLESSDIFKRSLAILAIINNKTYGEENFPILEKKAHIELINQLRSPNSNEQILALEVLSNLKSLFAFEQALSILNKFDLLTIKKKASEIVAKFAETASSKFAAKLLKVLKENKSSQVRLNCLSALGKIKDISSVQKIVELGAHFRPNEIRCIENNLASIGPGVLPICLSMLEDTTLHDKSRVLASKIIARIDLETLKNCFKRIILIEIEKAYFYLYNAKCIQYKYPSYDLSLLIEVLKTSFYSSIDFIIHLLAAVGSVEDCELLVRSLRSKNAKIHSHAVETLENACDRKIFKWISPLVDNLPWSIFIDAYTSLAKKAPQVKLTDILEQLNKSSSISGKLIAQNLSEVASQENTSTALNNPLLLNTNPTYLYETVKI